MRSGIGIVVTASDETRLEGLVAARESPQKYVWRARILLLTGDSLGTAAILAATGGLPGIRAMRLASAFANASKKALAG
jgi:hypothetical protein